MTRRTLPVQSPVRRSHREWTPERIARHRIHRAVARALSEMHEAHLAARQLSPAERTKVRDHIDATRRALASLDAEARP